MRQGKTEKKGRRVVIGKPQKDKGFTLIEVLIAISIFSIGMLAVASMQISAISVNAAAGRMTDRIIWAQDKIEELMALPYSDPWLEAAGNPPGLDSANNTHEETNPDGYTVSWDVTDNNPVPNTKLIIVSVTGRGKTTQLTWVKMDW